jgi:putative glycosyltransferase (TIGR04372 family)
MRKFKKAIICACVLPLLAIIRLLNPLITIKFCNIPSIVIGHFAFDPEYHLTEQKLNVKSAKVLILYYLDIDYVTANIYWEKMVKRNLPVSSLFWYLAYVNKLFKGWERHHYESAAYKYSTADVDEIFHRTSASIRFTENENEIGKDFLAGIGLAEGDKFICLQVRDSKFDSLYKNNLYKSKLYFGYDRVKYLEYRNADIENYVKACETLADKGYWVIRMGKHTNKSIPSKHRRIFDYSNSNKKTALLDIWLCHNCYFMITTGSGIDAFAYNGRRPMVYTNLMTYNDAMFNFSRSHILFKKIKDKGSNKYLSLSEVLVLESEIKDNTGSYGYWDKGLDFVENSPEEIEDVVLEMENRLTGKWHDTEIMINNQNAFISIYKKYSKQYERMRPKFFSHKVSSKFVTDNNWFLESNIHTEGDVL